jgi:hypothetical protein
VQHQRHERHRQLAGAVHVGEQLDGLGVAGAGAPTSHGDANSSRHSSSASSIATSSSNAASPNLSIIQSVEPLADEAPERPLTVQQRLRQSIVSLSA